MYYSRKSLNPQMAVKTLVPNRQSIMGRACWASQGRFGCVPLIWAGFFLFQLLLQESTLLTEGLWVFRTLTFS
jgi:hypothetical protein